MAPSSWDKVSENDMYDGDDKQDALELFDQRSALVSIANDWSASTSRLPPKTLPLRTTTHVVRKLFWTGLLAAVVIAGLGILTSSIHYFLPDRYLARGIHSHISCDLTLSEGGAVQNAFTINLRGATHLTFTEAKAIDVVWQLFVGAGGRFWLAWISYGVFMDGLTRLTEQSPISYNLYASLAFSTTSLWTTYYALKGLFFSKGWRSKMFLLWFAISTIYVLGFPTLMSATAGYVSPSTAGWNMTDGAFLTPESKDLKSCVNVHNGESIGYANDTVVPGPPVSQFDPDKYYSSIDQIISKVPDFERTDPLYLSLLNTSLYPPSPIYDATNSTKPPPYDLSKPLSVSMYTENYTIIYYIEGRPHIVHDQRLNSSWFYCYQNQTIDVKTPAKCLQTDYFVWGFSSLMVYINIFLFQLWILGMYIVWLDANIYSALCRSGRKLRGHFRAAADLSEAMKEVLGEETCAYTDSELAQELHAESGVQYYASDPAEGDVSHIGLSSRRLGKVPYNSTKLYGQHEKDR